MEKNWERLLQMGRDFQEAYYKKDWFRAKYLYDSAERIAAFLKPPGEIWEQLFWGYDEEKDQKVEGLFDTAMVDKVLHECVVKDSLGFECIVYRAPGEIGYYRARKQPGTRAMKAEDNPAFHAK